MPEIPRDGCLVTAEPFAELVRAHVEKWNRDRPQPGSSWVPREGPSPIQPLVWLSAEASHFADPFGIWRPKIIVPIGLLEKLLPTGVRARVTIELRVADAIAQALDEPWLIHDTERVTIKVNKRANAEARACCAGSLRDELVAA